MNLLPEENKILFKKYYLKRLSVVLGVLIFSIVAVGIIILIPMYSFILSYKKNLNGELAVYLKKDAELANSVAVLEIKKLNSRLDFVEKMSKAKTDSGPQSKMSKLPEEGAVANLFKIFGLFDVKRAKVFESQYLEGSIKYMEMKETLAEVIIEVLQPIREKRNDLERNKEYVKKILLEGSIEARHEAKINLNEVKQKMGLI